MTVEIQTRSVVHIGNDIADEFSFEFQLLDEEFLEVYLRNNATEVETLLEDSVYSVTFDDDGGTVTYPLSGSPISASYSIIIKRTVPYLQETEISNQGGFQPVVVEEQLDRIVMQIQQLAEDVVRAVKMKTGTAGVQFPSAEAEKYLGWNAAGTRLENKALATLGDVEVSDDDTLTATGELVVPQVLAVKTHLENNYQPLRKGFFHKPSRLAPCILRTGAGTLSLAAGTILEVEGNLFTYATDTAITMPTLAAGDDVAIWVRPDGQPVATLDHVSPPVTNSRKIGGAHYAPGGNATAYNTGGNTTPGFNAYSMWDEKFRPACADPRGMSLIAGKFWCDIYLLGVNHHTDGTSKYNVAIADGSSPPKIPTMFGGNGSTAYGSLTWWEAAEVLMSHGKDLLSYADFAAAMYGSTENSASGTDPVSTILRQAYTSIYGIMLATGNLWVWGSDFGGPFASAAWSNTNGGRGQVLNQSNAALLGGNWYNAESGSRASSWNDLPSNSNNTISARGRSDHLILA